MNAVEPTAVVRFWDAELQPVPAPSYVVVNEQRQPRAGDFTIHDGDRIGYIAFDETNESWSAIIGCYRTLVQTFIGSFDRFSPALNAALEGLGFEPEPEPAPRADGRPPVPRPSTTPPMWANNPGRTRRARNRASDIRTPKA